MNSGLYNFGNTCYLNSSIQCLANSKIFIDYLNSDEFKNLCQMKGNKSQICIDLFNLIYDMKLNKYIIKPLQFKNTFAKLNDFMNVNDQQDATEFLITLINNLNDALALECNITHKGIAKHKKDNLMIESIEIWSKLFEKNYSKIIEIFYGQLISKITCKTCNSESNSFDPFNLLKIEISGTNLNNCIQSFCKNELLDINESYKCDKCDKYTSAFKNINFMRLPKILIVCLKRFDHTQNRINKINKQVEIPKTLDLSEYYSGYDKNFKFYKLISCICHNGSAQFGHYYTYCVRQNCYIEYNDQYANEVRLPNLSYAYILFYEMM